MTFEERGEPRPWGFWATLGFLAAVLVVALALQLAIAAAFFYSAQVRNPALDLGSFLKGLSKNGFYLAIATLVSAPICAGLVILFAKLRRSLPVRDYLALRRPQARELAKWALLLGIVLILSELLTHILNYPAQRFMVDIYRTARSLPVLCVAFILVAPVFEELSFRGFLFQGIKYSPLGPTGAVILTASGWALLHSQYDPYGIVTILIIGLLLGIARLKSKSLYVPMAMHALWNLVAMIEVAIYVH